ncbi:hypothetical protein MMC27_008444 [Xylographa pallens]|nr:hypothetical protein [Xylographa pallens]
MAQDKNRPQRRVQLASQYNPRFRGGHASYNEAEYVHRSSESRNSGTSLVHRSVRDNPKSQAYGPKLPRKDFEHAISELFEQLERAFTFYSAVRVGFEADINKVKDYAKPLLGDVWDRKVVFMENRRDQLHLETLEEESSTMTLKSTSQRLEDSLDVAVHATPPQEPRRHDELEEEEGEEEENTTGKQIIQKVDREKHDILAFAASAIKKFGQLGPLITELNLLITYLSQQQSDLGS